MMLLKTWNGVIVLFAILCSTVSASETVAPAPPAELTPRRLQKAEPPREIALAVRSGTELSRQSQQSFLRGLLPLSDHLEHLAAAEEAAVRWVVTSIPSTESRRPALRQALQPRIDALRLAVRQMSGFRQPAAANWEADLLLGKYVLAQAEAETAALMGDRSAERSAATAQQYWAREHYSRRVFDSRYLGHATPSDLAQAVTFLNLSPKWKRQALQSTVDVMQGWQRAGADIGREDRTLNARLQMVLWDVESRGSHTSAAIIQRELIAADQLSTRLFQVQKDYWQHGTATLAELSRTWQTQRQLHLLSQWLDQPLSRESQQSWSRSLDDLSAIAQSEKDHRGRLAADVEYVHLLKYMHRVDQADFESTAQ